MVNFLQKKLKKISRYYLLIVIVFIALGVFLLSTIPSVRTSWAEATTVQPETFTELFFENHLNLPSVIKPNQPYYFEFTIHNMENKTMTYPYEVYLQYGSLKMPISHNTVTLKDNDYETIQEGFSINDPIFKSEIVVNLTNKNQQIDFWIQSTNPPVIKDVTANSTPTPTPTKKIVTKLTPTPKPTASLPTAAPTLIVTPVPTQIYIPVPTTAAASSSATKQYGGWYVHDGTAMVWLGTDSNGQDIWSTNLPQ